MNTFPTPPNPDTRNPPKTLTAEDWLKHQQVRNVNVLAVTPQGLKEAMRKL
jgi:hypothetical protein